MRQITSLLTSLILSFCFHPILLSTCSSPRFPYLSQTEWQRLQHVLSPILRFSTELCQAEQRGFCWLGTQLEGQLRQLSPAPPPSSPSHSSFRPAANLKNSNFLDLRDVHIYSLPFVSLQAIWLISTSKISTVHCYIKVRRIKNGGN